MLMVMRINLLAPPPNQRKESIPVDLGRLPGNDNRFDSGIPQRKEGHFYVGGSKAENPGLAKRSVRCIEHPR